MVCCCAVASEPCVSGFNVVALDRTSRAKLGYQPWVCQQLRDSMNVPGIHAGYRLMFRRQFFHLKPGYSLATLLCITLMQQSLPSHCPTHTATLRVSEGMIDVGWAMSHD